MAGTPLWLIRIIKRLFPHRFRLAELTRVPLLGRLIHVLGFENDLVYYVPRSEVVQINRPFGAVENLACPSRVVEHFIERARHLWIMNFCICRDSNSCRDYPVELGCLFLGEAVLNINPKLGRLVDRETARNHIRACRNAGLVHLIGRNKLDSLWLGARPAEKLMTICNCCPCCCLWRMLPHLSGRINEGVKRMPGVTLTVTERCIGCGTCAEGICFVDAIRIQNGRARISSACRGCGQCVEVCPQKAIELTLPDKADIEAAITRIEPRVNLS